MPLQNPDPVPAHHGARWVFPTLALLVFVAAIGATAAITYAITKSSSSAASAPTTTTAVAQGVSPEEHAAAKKRVCEVFDTSSRGQKGQGGVVVDGNPNTAILLRTLNSVVAVRNAMSPATPNEITMAAQKYIDSALRLTTAATGDASVDDLTQLTVASNDATYALADACGLPH
jgi:hypothetical protein